MSLKKHRRLARVFIAVAIPLVLLTALEGTLRLADFGVPTHFVMTGGKANALIDNQYFGFRFFPPYQVRTPAPLQMHAEKAGDEIRIALLGESAALGDPLPAFGPARFLEYLLNAAGTKHYRVINGAMTAVNSHVLREVARDLLVAQPDLYLIYMGNNEFVGPFGPATSGKPPTHVTRQRVLASRFRLAQLLSLSDHASAPNAWRGMEAMLEHPLRLDDPAIPATHSAFQRNIRKILTQAEHHDIPVVLSTVAVNLDRCAPFGSLHREGLRQDKLATWSRVYTLARKAMTEGLFFTALTNLQEAAHIDDTYAELHYLRGKCLEQTAQHDQAINAFAQARNLDSLRFRADDSINDILRDEAGNHANVTLLDTAQLFRDTRGATSDKPLFFDHVHFTPEGTYRFARLAAEQLLARFESEPGRIPSETETLISLGFNESTRAVILNIFLERRERLPFIRQIDHLEQMASLTEAKSEALLALRAVNPEDRFRIMRDLAARYPDDWRYHQQAGLYLLSVGRPKSATALLRKSVARFPHRFDLRGDLAIALALEQRTDRALALLEPARLRDNPLVVNTLLRAARELGNYGNEHTALLFLEAAHELQPDYGETTTTLAGLLSHLGRQDEATALLEQLVEDQPHNPDALAELGLLYTRHERWDEASPLFASAILAAPNRIATRRKQAVAMIYAGHTNDAYAALHELVERVPDAESHYLLGLLETRRGNWSEAADAFRSAVACRPDQSRYHSHLANALLRTGAHGEALEHQRLAARFR